MTVGKDGNNWFSDAGGFGFAPAIDMITPEGAITKFDLPQEATPYEITTGNDGKIWFDNASGGPNPALQYLNPKTGQFSTQFGIPIKFGQPDEMAFGPDNNLWFDYAATPNSIGVFIRLRLSVQPSSISLSVGQSSPLTATETRYSGLFTVSGCDPSIVTVSPTSPAKSFTVTAVGAGSCTLTVSDTKFNTSSVAVTVTAQSNSRAF